MTNLQRLISAWANLNDKQRQHLFQQAALALAFAAAARVWTFEIALQPVIIGGRA